VCLFAVVCVCTSPPSPPPPRFSSPALSLSLSLSRPASVFLPSFGAPPPFHTAPTSAFVPCPALAAGARGGGAAADDVPGFLRARAHARAQTPPPLNTQTHIAPVTGHCVCFPFCELFRKDRRPAAPHAVRRTTNPRRNPFSLQRRRRRRRRPAKPPADLSLSSAKKKDCAADGLIVVTAIPLCMLQLLGGTACAPDACASCVCVRGWVRLA